ncbi:MAG: DUF2723 domain-containing protein [Chloroflexi bacterium]|nr:DUF2723 domain-containing protein [Chloroflexota bacterium]
MVPSSGVLGRPIPVLSAAAPPGHAQLVHLGAYPRLAPLALAPDPAPPHRQPALPVFTRSRFSTRPRSLPQHPLALLHPLLAPRPQLATQTRNPKPETAQPHTSLPLPFLFLILYLLTLGRTVGKADTFEFQVVAPQLGIAHPTGYPLYLLLGKLWTLIPIGSVAWRLNLGTALYAAAAAGLLYLLFNQLARGRGGGAGKGRLETERLRDWSGHCLLLTVHGHRLRHPPHLLEPGRRS